MRRIVLLPLTFSLLFPSSSALALPTRTVFAEQAQGFSGSGINLEVPPGYGLTINFIETGEVVKQAWIGDPSRFVFSSNGNLCPQGLQDSNCTNTGATVIFLRQIQPVNFPGLVSSADGGTQLTLITEGVGGQKQYSFGLSASSTTGKPKYTTLIVKPESEKPVPLPSIPSRSTPAVSPPLLEQLPTITSSVQPQQRTLTQNYSSNIGTATTTTEQPLAVPAPTPSFARTTTRISTNPIPQTNWIPESPKQPVRASTPRRTPTSTKIATSSAQRRVATLNRPSSSRKVSQQSRATIHKPLTTKPQQATAKPKVHRVTTSRATRERTAIAINSSVVRANKNPQQSTDDANAIAFGLRTANENGQIKARSTMWRKAQSAIRLLRRGKTRVEAAQIANIPQNTLDQLIKWGQERP